MAQNQVSKTVCRMKIDYTAQVPVWTLAFGNELSLKAVLLKGGMTAEAVRSGYGYKIQQLFRVSAVSACETDWGFSRREDFWFIVAIRSEDEAASGPAKRPADAVVKDIRRATRRQFSAEEKIRIVLEGLRGEESIAELCRREGIASSMYYGWSKEFLEAGKKRLAGDTARAATSDEVRTCGGRPVL